MSSDKICPRCRGQKKMYKFGGGYSSVPTGSGRVSCPCCGGNGKIDLEKIEEDVKKLRGKKTRKKATSGGVIKNGKKVCKD